MFTGSDTELQLECVVPTAVAVLVSWVLIHRRRPIPGIIAGVSIILLLLLAWWLYVNVQISRYDPSSPERDIAYEGWALVFGIGLVMAILDGAAVLGISVILALLYEVFRPSSMVEESPSSNLTNAH